MQPTAIQHIELRASAIHGQKACIAGTRISVQDIYVWHELLGKTPDQIVVEYPFLSLADVHSALAYYHDHVEELREQVRRGREEAAHVRAASPPKLPDRLGTARCQG